MANKTILVTGGTGFVGNRLTERLVLGTDYSVTALIHRFSGPGLTRLARLPVNLVKADLLDEESLLRAAENCHIIIHLAYGNTGDEDTRVPGQTTAARRRRGRTAWHCRDRARRGGPGV